jgi:hypothetical protein
MVIEVAFMCWSKAMGSYLYTRLPATRFIPLAIFLATAGLAASPPAHISHWLLAAMLALTLTLQFRLWDDIADRDHDRETHPTRVLCHTPDMKPFLIAAAFLFALNGTLLAWHQVYSFKPIAYLVLCTCLLAWYNLRSIATQASLLNSQLVLLKYPVIAWLLGVSAADTDLALLLSCLFSVYLIFIIFEILDDHRLHQLPGAMFSLAANIGLLVFVWAFIALRGIPYAGTLFWVFWSLIIIGTLAAGLSAFSKLKHQPATGTGHSFFIVGLLAYLAVIIENKL